MHLRDALAPLPPLFHPTRILHISRHVNAGTPLAALVSNDMDVETTDTIQAASVKLAACASIAPTTVEAIAQTLSRPERFTQFSVIVCDATNSLTETLEFLHSQRNSPAGRILLLNEPVSEKVVQAQHDGAIDRFVDLSGSLVLDRLNAVISDLRWRFFMRLCRGLAERLSTLDFIFLRDPIFITVLKKTLVKIDAIEMYLHLDPLGLGFLDAEGKKVFLAVQRRTHPMDIPIQLSTVTIHGLLDDYVIAVQSDGAKFVTGPVISYAKWLWN